nr:hypothetical protein [Tanacetum cinerariifolium]
MYFWFWREALCIAQCFKEDDRDGDVHVHSKAPKYPSPTKEAPQGKNLGARSGLKRKQSSKHTSESTTEASKSKSGHSNKEAKSSSAIDTSPSHLSPPTPVVGEMYEEAQQAVDTRSAFFTPDSPTDEPIIISDVSKEEENAENDKDTKDTSVPLTSLKSAQLQELMAQVYLLQSRKKELERAKVIAKTEVASMKAKPSYSDINQLTELLVTSLKPKLSKLLASHDFASFLPTELKELPSKIIRLSGEIKELNRYIKDMEIELPGDLKKISSKLESFTSTISNLSSQEKLKTLNSLSSFLKMVTNTLNMFATMVENASGATTAGVPSADKATASPAEGEKDADTNLKNELVDLLGIYIITQYYNKKRFIEQQEHQVVRRLKQQRQDSSDDVRSSQLKRYAKKIRRLTTSQFTSDAEIIPDQAMKAIETPLNSPMGTMWCLYDPTPSVREEAGHPITKHVNAISLVKKEKEKNLKNNEVNDKNVVEPSELDVVEPIELVDRKEGMGDGTDDEFDESMKEELT